MKTSKNGSKIQQDSSGHYYLIEIDQLDNFNQWITASEEGKFDKMKDYGCFAQCRIESPYGLIIYNWE